MYSMLVVDDEVIIADGLYQMLQEAFADRLVVRRCYSYEEAKAVLMKNRIDILMTDIEMPGASGLELHRLVRERWPMIQVIYLTGYAEFDYARQAMEQKALAYVLKSEGDQAIARAVEKAICAFEEENQRMLQRAAEGGEQSRRLRQLVFHAMHGGALHAHELRRAIEDSGVALGVDAPIRIGYCFFDDAVPSALLYQSMHLIEQLMKSSIPILLTEMSARGFSLVYRAESDDGMDVLCGLLESAQHLLERQGYKLTVCLLDEPVRWQELDARTSRMLELINQTSPVAGELVLLHSGMRFPHEEPTVQGDASAGLESLRRMKELLLIGQQDLFFEESAKFWHLQETERGERTDIVRALATMMRDCSVSGGIAPNRWKLSPDMPLPEMRRQLDTLARELFNQRTEKQQVRQKRLVTEIDQYILQHLDGDLSLTAIADALHFHPSYISRVYNENSGVSLSDSIAKQRLKRACLMLTDTRQSIASIAAATGFNTANYFARWFRKWMGCTAQEYREAQKGLAGQEKERK